MKFYVVLALLATVSSIHLKAFADPPKEEAKAPAKEAKEEKAPEKEGKKAAPQAKGAKGGDDEELPNMGKSQDVSLTAG